MKIIFLMLLVLSFILSPILVDAHQSGCHRWHSCPSDSGSYVCGDLGYYTYCPKSTPSKSETPKTIPKPQTESKTQSPIPKWIKNSAAWWADKQIDDATFVSGIQYLVKEDILNIPPTTQGTNYGTNQIPTWIRNNAGWWADGSIDDNSFVQGIQFLIKEGIVNLTKDNTIKNTKDNTIKNTKDNTINDPKEDAKKNICSGNARCISGVVTEIIDGDTIKVDEQSIRFALASAPELDDGGGTSARNFIESICPVGSNALVDEDDEQTRGSHGRILGVIYCNDVNLNEELLISGHGRISSAYCSFSEFSNHDWARKYGC